MNKKQPYTAVEQCRFVKFFAKPPRKRGRPKKKKVLRGKHARDVKKTKRTEEIKAAQSKAKEKAVLQADLEGTIAIEKHTMGRRSRINWDTPENKRRRERIANSWSQKGDLYRAGESFARYCARVGIHEGSLRRFLKADGAYVTKKRGRKTLLTESVMRHICEGNDVLLCVIVIRFLIV